MPAASAMVAHTEDTSAVTIISAHGLRSSHAMMAPTVTDVVKAMPARTWLLQPHLTGHVPAVHAGERAEVRVDGHPERDAEGRDVVAPGRIPSQAAG